MGTRATNSGTASNGATGASAASVRFTVADGLPELATVRTVAAPEAIVHGDEHATLVAFV